MLKLILILNAISCILFGGLFLLESDEISKFIGSLPLFVLQVLGVGLLVNGLLLLLLAMKATPPRRDVILFALGDAVWVIVSMGLLITGVWITNADAFPWVIGVAVFVGFCGFMQWQLSPTKTE